MNEKYEKAIEMLMKDKGFVWYDNEWMSSTDAFIKDVDKGNIKL